MRLKKEVYNAAIYLRISRDDDDKVESDSIQNQRELLRSYIQKKPEIKLEKEFVDDGYTGTSFDRPGFKSMMEEIMTESIDCVIVKDLSRLGRNYIETGRYIDQIFPALGIRFISVNDNYDSESDFNDADNIIIPFKNLINDAYCRDISMKMRSNLDTMRKNGKFTGSFATFGYKKDPYDKHHLIIDEPAAIVVRQIFNMRMEGYSLTRIADKLNELGVLTPLMYKRSVGLNCHAGYWKGAESKWFASTVQRVLTNEMYLGNMVQGKSRKINYKVKKCCPVNREEWIRVYGTHEPLVSKVIFDRVQEMQGLDIRTSPNSETVDVFAGLVKCGGCGENMTRRIEKRGNKEYCYFTCSTAKTGAGCSSHLINEGKIENTVLALVQKQMELLLNIDQLLDTIDPLPKASHRYSILEEQRTTLEREIARFQDMKEKLYEDLNNGIINETDYNELKERFIQKIEENKKALMVVEAKKEELLSTPLLPPDWLSEIRDIGKISTLTRKTVIMLIDKIIVHSKDRIEIKFNYGDEIEHLMAMGLELESAV